MLKVPTVSKIELEDHLHRHYDLGTLLAFEKMKKGLGNALYKVTTTKGKYTLKISIRNNPVRVKYEIHLLTHLYNLPTPQPIQTKSKGYLPNYKGHKSFIYPYLPGKQKRRFTDMMLSEIGTFLGELHLQTEGFKSPIKRIEFYNFHPKNFAEVIKDSLLAKNQKIQNAVSYLKESTLKYVLPKGLPEGAMHIDVKPENTLFNRGHLSGIVDFDNSYNGPLILDLAATLMWFCSEKGKFNFPRAKIIYNAYNRARKLRSSELKAFFKAFHYAFLSHVLADIYLNYSKDFPEIELPESYMIWEIENLLETEKNLKISEREFLKLLS
jgi:homoserine kinase type II